jgi:transcription-repair coupling factor (superfamily II helicase)
VNENLRQLIELYTQSDRSQQLLKLTTKDTPTRIQVKGLIGSQDCFVLLGLYHNDPRINILIAQDKEEAAYIQNSIDAMVEGRKCFFFPDSFKRPSNYEELNSTNILQRTETVNKINTRASYDEIIVTYPEAIFEKVVDPRILDGNKIEIVKEESLDVDTIIEVLVEYGFERSEYVYEPGQFAVRGGIVDIFSFGNEWPYRIDLFDDEVESIRTFNPSDQLSIQEIRKVSIIPNINSKFKQEEKISLFELFEQKANIWVKDLDMLLDKLQFCFEKVEEFAKSIEVKTNAELKAIFDDRAFIYPDQIIQSLSAHNILLLNSTVQQLQLDGVLEVNADPQPSFNKNFKLLLEDLNGNVKSGLENYIFTESKKQIERFYNIFEDLNADVHFHPVNTSIHLGYIDRDLKIAMYTDHQIFDRFHKYTLRKGFTKEQALNLKMLRELQPGDFISHIDHGVGRYSGLEKIEVGGKVQESLRIFYQNNDVLYVSINSLHKISKHVGKDGTPPKLSKIGGDAWKNLKRKTKKKVKDIAKELIKLYAKRKSTPGYAFPADGYLQNELEASFIYEDTPDQEAATEAVKEDMMAANPMDRLICGDVGFGKTEIALRAVFKAIVAGKQAAILVPTTILALQHFKTFKDRFEQFGITVDYINRFRTTKEKRLIYERLANGELECVIGTHGLLNKQIKFKDLGILVIDEEQKFGVAAKEKLRKLSVNVDTLTLTATPIPRTLQFSLMSARDLSIIRTPPPNRQPIHTERRLFNDEVIRESIYYEVNRGGQVFFVHNRVKSLIDIAAMVKRLCPDVRVAMAHGQMDSKKLEDTLMRFIEHEFDVLVCTNIIETGLDISNANTIIINNAHQFGMSDLHQLRGRVGRSNKKAYCYLFAPPLSTLTTDARKRIQTLEEFSDLGSGFHIAMRDLDIRGAGNLLGAEQSGFISDIGYETYQKILEEAVMELKEGEFKEVFKDDLKKEREYVRDVEVDTDIEMLIPDEYVSNIQERLSLYTELDKIENEEGIERFEANLKDRFGPVPKQVKELFEGLRLRWICKQLGFERLSLKNRKLRCYFITNAQSTYFESDLFNKILAYVSTKGHHYEITLKQSRNYLLLVKDGVHNLREVKKILERIKTFVKS